MRSIISSDIDAAVTELLGQNPDPLAVINKIGDLSLRDIKRIARAAGIALAERQRDRTEPAASKKIAQTTRPERQEETQIAVLLRQNADPRAVIDELGDLSLREIKKIAAQTGIVLNQGNASEATRRANSRSVAKAARQQREKERACEVEKNRAKREERDQGIIAELQINPNASAAARKFGVCQQTASICARKAGIELTSKSSCDLLEKHMQIIEAARLCSDPITIMKLVKGVSQSTVRRVLKNNGIAIVNRRHHPHLKSQLDNFLSQYLLQRPGCIPE